jgi:hypothetical protein
MSPFFKHKTVFVEISFKGTHVFVDPVNKSSRKLWFELKAISSNVPTGGIMRSRVITGWCAACVEIDFTPDQNQSLASR